MCWRGKEAGAQAQFVLHGRYCTRTRTRTELPQFFCFGPKYTSCRVSPQIPDSIKYILQAAKQAWRGFSSGFSQVPQSDMELAHVGDAKMGDEDEDIEEDEGRGRGAHPTSSGADSPPASRSRAEQATHRVEGGSCGWTLLAWLGRGRQVWAHGRGWVRQGDDG